MAPRLVLLALALLTAGTAQAQTVQTAYAGGTPVVLTIPVTASVGGRCGFATAPSGTYNQANFDQTGLAAQFDFALNCTGPSRVAVLSSNGGLLSSTASGAGYGNKADYSVTLNLAANDGSSAQATCTASTLVSGSTCGFVGTASTTQGLRLAAAAVNQSGSYLRISAPKQTGSTVLVAGVYSDSLTVTVSPAL
jgi:hypothetical protein